MRGGGGEGMGEGGDSIFIVFLPVTVRIDFSFLPHLPAPVGPVLLPRIMLSQRVSALGVFSSPWAWFWMGTCQKLQEPSPPSSSSAWGAGHSLADRHVDVGRR